MQQVHLAASVALNLLFPPRCGVCGRPGSELCAACRSRFTPLGSLTCPVCAEPRSEPGLCTRCARAPRAFQRVRCGFRYEGAVRQAVHAFKYRRRRHLAGPLAEEALRVLSPPDSALVVCPVPLHPARQTERGYNQSALLAHPLAAAWSLPILPPAALTRSRVTPQQVGRDYAARQQNVLGAFAADPFLVRGYAVLLVDDVCTTGATLNACAETLLGAGAARVEALTLARAVGTLDTL